MAELNWRSDNTVNPGMLSAHMAPSAVNVGVPLTRRFVSVSAPILKALTIVCIFIVSNIGYSPMGCKTQYLFSNKLRGSLALGKSKTLLSGKRGIVLGNSLNV